MNNLFLRVIGFIILVQCSICYHLAAADEKSQIKNDKIAIERLPLNVTLNSTKLILPVRRKSVLILNSGTGLRSTVIKEVTSLLYQDYDDNGNLLNNIWMYNLKDVSEFFKVFLDTEICYVQCRGAA